MKSNLPNQRAFASIDSSAGRIFRAALFVIYTIFFMLNLTAAAQAVVPVNGTPPLLTQVTINAGPGNQIIPRVSGDLAAYRSDNTARYYNFSTAIDAEIPLLQPGPPTELSDFVFDVSGTKITFTRFADYGLPPPTMMAVTL